MIKFVYLLSKSLVIPIITNE